MHTREIWAGKCERLSLIITTARILSRYQTQYKIAIKEKEQLQSRKLAEKAELRKQLSEFEIKCKTDARMLNDKYASIHIKVD